MTNDFLILAKIKIKVTPSVEKPFFIVQRICNPFTLRMQRITNPLYVKKATPSVRKPLFYVQRICNPFTLRMQRITNPLYVKKSIFHIKRPLRNEVNFCGLLRKIFSFEVKSSRNRFCCRVVGSNCQLARCGTRNKGLRVCQ